MTGKRSIRIAYTAEQFPSASETWIHHEIRELRRLGCTVMVFATLARPDRVPAEMQDLVQGTVYLPEIPAKFWNGLRGLKTIVCTSEILRSLIDDTRGMRQKAQVLRDAVRSGRLLPAVAQFEPDLLFAHFGGSRATVALMLSAKIGVPFAVKFHAADVFNRMALLRLKSRRAAFLTTISEYNIEFMKQEYPDIDMSRVEKHSCGIPLDDYPYRRTMASDDVNTVVAVGRLVRMKGFDLLLQASKRLVDLGVDHKLIIVGDGPERQRLESLRNKLSLQRVATMVGYAPPDMVKSVLLKATVFVLPCIRDPVLRTQDGIPVALMEAMALGIPVVSTRISGIPEMVEDGVSGFLVEPGNPDELAEAIQRSLSLSGEERRRMTSAAREVIEMKHNIQELTKMLLARFRQSVN